MSRARAQIELRQLTLDYPGTVAVRSVDLEVERGSFVTLVGPSGCGKTSLLRAIAGLITPRHGDILIAGRRVNEVPIHRRNVGLVFQSYALFPHRNVFDNVAFGLKYRGVDRAAIARRVGRALEMVRLPDLGRRMPGELSGGQQQRIALARAIVIEPDVLLLDEPFSALDAKLREDLRLELKTIQRDLGVTTLFVTHDQQEALALSDRVAVMHHGAIEQYGTPEEVYSRPASRFVAGFCGRSNVLSATVERSEAQALQLRLVNGLTLLLPPRAPLERGARLEIVVRAERVTLHARPPAPAPNCFAARIRSAAYLGDSAAYVVELLDAGGLSLHALVPLAGALLREGEAVHVSVAPADCSLFDERGRRAAETPAQHAEAREAVSTAAAPLRLDIRAQRP